MGSPIYFGLGAPSASQLSAPQSWLLVRAHARRLVVPAQPSAACASPTLHRLCPCCRGASGPDRGGARHPCGQRQPGARAARQQPRQGGSPNRQGPPQRGGAAAVRRGWPSGTRPAPAAWARRRALLSVSVTPQGWACSAPPLCVGRVGRSHWLLSPLFLCSRRSFCSSTLNVFPQLLAPSSCLLLSACMSVLHCPKPSSCLPYVPARAAQMVPKCRSHALSLLLLYSSLAARLAPSSSCCICRCCACIKHYVKNQRASPALAQRPHTAATNWGT